MTFCTKCGVEAHPGAAFCMSCGAPVLHVEGPPSNVYVFALAEHENDPNYAVDFFEVELVGESRHEGAFARILGRLAEGEDKTLDDVLAVLVREPKGHSEEDAIDVCVLDAADTYHRVGHFSTADAREYSQTLRELERRAGRIVGCLARVDGTGRTPGRARPLYSARVYVPDAQEWLKWKF